MTDKKSNHRGLGRGLTALMADVNADFGSQVGRAKRSDVTVAIEKIRPNPNQPRRVFEPTALTELADSL